MQTFRGKIVTSSVLVNYRVNRCIGPREKNINSLSFQICKYKLIFLNLNAMSHRDVFKALSSIFFVRYVNRIDLFLDKFC